MDRVMMAICRALLGRTTTLQGPGDVTVIDSTSFEQVAASRRYAKRTDYPFLAIQTTLLVDCRTGPILDIHCTITRAHHTKIGWEVLKRNLDRLDTITADKGYDSDDLRWWLRANDVRSVINHREMGAMDAAHNAYLVDETDYRRSVSEVDMRVLKQRYGDRLSARTHTASSEN